MKGKDCVYIVRVCECERAFVHARNLWCPWLSSVYRQEMFVQAKGKKSHRPIWQTLVDTHIHANTHILSTGVAAALEKECSPSNWEIGASIPGPSMCQGVLRQHTEAP